MLPRHKCMWFARRSSKTSFKLMQWGSVASWIIKIIPESYRRGIEWCLEWGEEGLKLVVTCSWRSSVKYNGASLLTIPRLCWRKIVREKREIT